MTRKTRRLSNSGDCLLSEEDNNIDNITDENQIPLQKQNKRIRLSSSSRRLSISGRRSTNFDLHLSQIYTDCIQLGTKNKINQQNAWKTKLVDVMDKILVTDLKDKNKSKSKSKKSKNICNFQVATNTLDTSVKIYSYRVDSVHNDTYRVLSGLNRTTKQNINKDSNNEEQDTENQQKTKKRKTVSLSHTLDTLNNLNTKRLDMEYSVDPLFHKTAAAFDEGGAKGLLLSQLGISKGCNVVFDSIEYNPEEIVDSKESYLSSSLLQYLNPDWEITTICPYFEDFSFNYDNESSDKLNSSSQELPSLDEYNNDYDQESFEDYSNSFDILSQHEDFSQQSFDNNENLNSQQDNNDFILSQQMDTPDNDNPCEIALSQDNNNSNDNIISFNISNTDPVNDGSDIITNMFNGISSSIPSIDTIKNFVSDSSDYNYFNNSLINSNWAGPEHWKFKITKNKPLKNTDNDEENDSIKPQTKKRTKRDFFIDFFSEDETDYNKLLKPAKRGGTISKESLLNSTKPTTLPFVDCHYSITNLTQLFSKPDKIISFNINETETNENIEESSLLPLTFENDDPLIMDIDDNNMNNMNMDNDIDEGGFAFNDWGDSQNSVDFGSQLSTDGLIDAPDLVRNIKISYARRAKRVDIEKLKNSIWTELCVVNYDENQTPNKPLERTITDDITEEKVFSDILSTLPNSVPQSQMNDLSVPLCFICLLDLANKKGLQIDQQNNDLSISKYQKQSINA